jgi:hypothetical protein
MPAAGGLRRHAQLAGDLGVGQVVPYLRNARPCIVLCPKLIGQVRRKHMREFFQTFTQAECATVINPTL